MERTEGADPGCTGCLRDATSAATRDGTRNVCPTQSHPGDLHGGNLEFGHKDTKVRRDQLGGALSLSGLES